MMDVVELRDLSVEDLQARAKELEDQLFRMRLQQSLGQLDAPLKLRFTRRDLARIKTVITEKQQKNGGALGLGIGMSDASRADEGEGTGCVVEPERHDAALSRSL